MIETILPLRFERDLKWIRSKVPYIVCEDAFGAVAMDRMGRYLGAVIFDNLLYSCAQMTLIIDSQRAVKLGLLEWAAQQIFGVHSKQFVYAMVADSNWRSRRLCKRVGFEHELTIPEGHGPNDDMLVLKLRKEKLNLKSRKVRGDYA